MKTVFLLLITTTLSYGQSLQQFSNGIIDDLKQLKYYTKRATVECDGLELKIPQFNELNNAQNKTLADLRIKKIPLDVLVADLRALLTQQEASYAMRLGQIQGKKDALNAAKKTFVVALMGKRKDAQKELVAVNVEKNALERKLRDLDNFSSPDEYTTALGRFYFLKGRAIGLMAVIAELTKQLSNPTPTSQSQLESEIKDLEAQATVLRAMIEATKRDLSAASSNLGIMVAKIKALETKLNALANFTIPEICKSL